MLNKLIAVKVLAALTVAGLGTGAAAGELPDPLQDLASEAAQIVDVQIPDPDREADEVEKAAEKAAKDAEKAAEKVAEDAEKAAEQATKDAEKAAEKAAKDAEKAAGESESAKDPEKAAEKAAKDAEKAARDAEKADRDDHEADEAGDPAKKVKRENHGAVVSQCARTTKLHGGAKGQAISALARGDVDQCDLGEGSGDRARKEPRQADKEAKKAAKEQRQASKGAGQPDPAE